MPALYLGIFTEVFREIFYIKVLSTVQYYEADSLAVFNSIHHINIECNSYFSVPFVPFEGVVSSIAIL